MRLFAFWALANLCLAQAPEYSLAGLVDAAGNVPGRLAPNSRGTLYGKNLSIPSAVGGGLRLRLGLLEARLTHISDTQLNFIVPSDLLAGVKHNLIIQRGSLAGPVLAVTIHREAPELFLFPNSSYALAALPDGKLVSPDSPASPGSVVVLYANGLGPTEKGLGRATPATTADSTSERLDIWLDGRPLPPEHVLYSGVAPGYVALYQINVRLPEDVGPNPLIGLGFRGESSSHPGVRLAVAVQGSGNASTP